MGSSRGIRAKFFQRHSVMEKLSMKNIKMARKKRYDESRIFAAALGRSKPNPSVPGVIESPNQTAQSRTVDTQPPCHQEQTDVAACPMPMDIGMTMIEQITIAPTPMGAVRNKDRRNSVSVLPLPTPSSPEVAPKRTKARRNTTIGHASGDNDAFAMLCGLRRSARPAAAAANASIQTRAYANAVIPANVADSNVLPSIEDSPCGDEIVEVTDSEADDDGMRPSTAVSNASDAPLVALPPANTDNTLGTKSVATASTNSRKRKRPKSIASAQRWPPTSTKTKKVTKKPKVATSKARTTSVVNAATKVPLTPKIIFNADLTSPELATLCHGKRISLRTEWRATCGFSKQATRDYTFKHQRRKARALHARNAAHNDVELCKLMVQSLDNLAGDKVGYDEKLRIWNNTAIEACETMDFRRDLNEFLAKNADFLGKYGRYNLIRDKEQMIWDQKMKQRLVPAKAVGCLSMTFDNMKLALDQNIALLDEVQLEHRAPDVETLAEIPTRQTMARMKLAEAEDRLVAAQTWLDCMAWQIDKFYPDWYWKWKESAPEDIE
ncbi:hypothetical protein LZ32DRAFT_650348 [Colletotrichum eremochloae]|nr:hypothetical protein LZ32DRAFT_650348 [Colletotrichum eremochloae]